MRYQVIYQNGTVGELETDETAIRLEQHAHISTATLLSKGESTEVVEPVVEPIPEPVLKPEPVVEPVAEPVKELITEVV